MRKEVLLVLILSVLAYTFHCGSCIYGAEAKLSEQAKTALYNDGMADYQKKDYHKALKIFQGLADSGDSRGQNCLGVMIELGQAIPQDTHKAMDLFIASAKQGNARAAYNLGDMYRITLRNQPSSQEQALSWYKKAAELGDKDAELEVARLNKEIRDSYKSPPPSSSPSLCAEVRAKHDYIMRNPDFFSAKVIADIVRKQWDCNSQKVREDLSEGR